MRDDRFAGWRRDARLAFPRVAWLQHVNAVVVLTLLVHVGWLVLLERSLVCPCGVVELWQSRPDAARNSQQFADAYSLLHIAFGSGLCLASTWIRPNWPVVDRAVLAMISSTAWEMVENTPVVIALLNNAANAAPDYHGDSVLNSLADTAFALSGFAIATRLPLRWTIGLVLLLELTATALVEDGFVLIVWRLAAGLQT